MSTISKLSNLVEFLELHKVKKGEQHSHMSYGNLKKAHFIFQIMKMINFLIYIKKQY